MFGKRCRFGLILAGQLFASACTPPTPDESLADAESAIAAGEALTAEIHLKNLLQREPNYLPARILLGQLSLAMGDAAGAEHNLQTALDLGGDAAAIQLPLLRARLAQNEFTQVLAQAEAGPVLQGEAQALVLNIVGAAHRALGRLDRAEEAYRAALAIDPKSLLNRTELAAVHFQTGRLAEARAAVDAVLDEQDSFVPALLLLGSMDAAAGRHVAAQTTFERVLAIEAERPNGTAYALALAQLAEAHLAQRNLVEAGARADELLALNGQAPVARYLKARVEMEQQDMVGAERRLEQLIADVPDYWPAYLLLGVINANQSQLGQAEMYLRRAANSNPRDTRAQLLLAEVYIRQNNVGEAREVLDGSAATNNGLFLALAGRASLDAGQPELAAEYFARSEQSQPGTLQELIDVSSVYVAAGEIERAIRVLESASFQEPESERLANYLLTLVQLRRGNLAAADATARRLNDPRPESLNLRGTIAMLSKDLNRARTLYEEALRQQSDYVPAMLNLARVAVAQRRNEAAEEYLRRAIEINPDQINAVFGMVQLAAERKDFEAAETWLARAPESVLRSRLAGDLHFAEGRFDAAADNYDAAFGLRPTVDLALRSFAAARQAGRPQPEAALLSWSEGNPDDARANFALGTVALERDDRAAAVRRYERVLEAEPAHMGALNNLAWLYSEAGDERALGLAERAYAVQPNDPSIADTLGWLKVQQGDAAGGLALLERAAAGLPENAEVRYHWAVALAETGATRQAADLLEALVAGDADFPGKADARDRLAALESGGSP